MPYSLLIVICSGKTIRGGSYGLDQLVCPGINLKRWLLLFAGGVLCCAIGLALFFNYQFMGFVEEMLFRMSYLTTGKYSNTVSMLTGFISLCAGLFIMYYATRKIIRSVVEAVMPDNNASLMEIIFTQRKLTRGPAITVVGGGTGLFNSAARYEIYYE